MKTLVGPPGFEPGTSCTPSKKYQSLTGTPNNNTRLQTTSFGRQMDAKSRVRVFLDSTQTPQSDWPSRARLSPFFQNRLRKQKGSSNKDEAPRPWRANPEADPVI